MTERIIVKLKRKFYKNDDRFLKTRNMIIRNWWWTYPPRSLDCSIWVKSLRAKRAVLEENSKEIKSKKTSLPLKYEQYSKITYKNEVLAFFSRHTTEHCARLWTWVEGCDTRYWRKYCKLSLRVWRGGTMEILHRRHYSAAEVGSVFCTEVGMPGRAEPPG